MPQVSSGSIIRKMVKEFIILTGLALSACSINWFKISWSGDQGIKRPRFDSPSKRRGCSAAKGSSASHLLVRKRQHMAHDTLEAVKAEP